MSSLMEAVRAGRTAEVVSLLDGMTDGERRSYLPELRALRKELRADQWNAASRRAYPALHAAGAACQTGAAGVATWLAATDMRWSQASPALLIHLLGDRPADWLVDVTHRLAQRPESAGVRYDLLAGLVRLSGGPVPTTPTYVHGWVDHVGSARELGNTLLDRLRKDPHLATLVAAAFETPDIGSRWSWTYGEGPDSWAEALARLTAEGTLERRATVDACVARLVRGGSAADQRSFLRLLRSLALTREEERERITDWLALAADAMPVVASHAQSVLGTLALAGDLTPRRLAEMSAAVLFRTEKKLVRAQLVLLGRVLVADPSAAPELLPAAAHAFGHEDSDVQERALKLVERHAGKVADTADATQVREELVVAAEQLIPALHTRASRALGAPVASWTPEYEETLPPVPQPVRLAPAPGTAVEVAEEAGALLASGGGVTEFERTLDGLVRHAYQDRGALLEALEPVVSRRWWNPSGQERVLPSQHYFGNHGHGFSGAEDGVDLLLATLSGAVFTTTLESSVRQGARTHECVHSGLSRAFDARLWDVAYRIRTDPLPFLLSTPTWSTGLLEPGELVARLDTYRRLGARVSAADFAQALLRVRRGDRPAAEAAAERATALGTGEGARLAAWLAQDPTLPTDRRRTSGVRVLLELGELPQLREDFPAAFQGLGRPVSVFRERWYCHHWNRSMQQHWPAVLPELRELVAVRLLRDLSALAVDDSRGAAAVLPQLAEAGGEAGEAVHLGLAYGLGARHPEDRLAAVDALLVLAARGQLDTALLGADLGQLVRRGAVKPSRLAESARTAAATGANATIWGVLRQTLPVLLADLATEGAAAPTRGVGDLVGVAAECAERSGARGDLPHLAGAAARRGSSRLVAQARRLRDTLGEEQAA
ncbi:DUF6493 family protein [Streptomyces sp. NPDC005574]|uniref:DUF7824 domain-containing protein n=1 Tax=Streptomyces sp. NPDC005574 TaxID=3156891 RepID=UPI0033A048DE